MQSWYPNSNISAICKLQNMDLEKYVKKGARYWKWVQIFFELATM